MKHHNKAIVSLLLVLLGSGIQSQAAVITDNNLQSASLPSLANSANTTVSDSNFATVSNELVAVQANINKVSASSVANAYVVDSLTPGGGSDAVNWGGGIPATYSVTNTLKDFVTAPQTLSYNLNVGVSGFKQYTFTASNINFYKPAGADAGLITIGNQSFGDNLVPNASFENSTLNFFTGGSIISNPGKQGSHVMQILSTTETYLALPVVPGLEYAYSFWYQDTQISGGYGLVEWGLSAPVQGVGVGAGNSGTSYLGTTPWTEATGTFTPQAGQTTFYISGMVNANSLLFDSFYVAALPEPSTLFLIVPGGLLLWRRSRRQRP